jgi:hypothetical protein
MKKKNIKLSFQKEMISKLEKQNVLMEGQKALH